MLFRSEGVTVLYSLADDRTFSLCALMCDRVQELAEAAADFGASLRMRR